MGRPVAEGFRFPSIRFPSSSSSPSSRRAVLSTPYHLPPPHVLRPEVAQPRTGPWYHSRSRNLVLLVRTLPPPLRLVPSTTLGRIPYPSASWTWPRFVLTTPDAVTMSQWDSLRACRACDSSLCLVARLPLPRRAGRYPLWHEKMGEILDGIQLHPIW